MKANTRGRLMMWNLFAISLVVLAMALSLTCIASRVDMDDELLALESRVLQAEKFDHTDNPHEHYALICIQEAFQAAKDGNYGVGACLVNADGKVIVTEHNHVYWPYHRGYLHAEMSVFRKVDEEHRDGGALEKTCTLYTSVEPCMMCFARTIGSGVRACYYVADDPPSGMVHLSGGIPPSYKPRLEGRTFAKCKVSDELEQLAKDIYNVSFSHLGKRHHQ